MSTHPQHRPSRFRLVAEIDDRVRSFPLKRGENLVGTLPGCQLRLEIPGISRRHARIEVAESQVSIADLGSKNGTIVNGNRIEQVDLELGDEIELCHLAFTLERLDAADSALAFSLTGPATGSGEWGGKTTQARPDSIHHEIAAPAAVDAARRIWHRLFAPGAADTTGALRELATTAGAAVALLLEKPTAPGPISGAAGPSSSLVTSHGAVEPSRLAELEAALEGRGASAAPAAGLAAYVSPAGWTIHGGQGGEEYDLWLALDGGRRGSTVDALADLCLDWIRHARHGDVAAPPSQDFSSHSLRFPDGFIRGHSAAIESVYSQLRHLTQGDVPVLIIGDTGVGKEVMARTLHLSSERAEGPMVAINCAAIPAELLESELFGIDRGVATGVSARPGRIAEAHGGTLFLDEIGDMPANLQAKLLRVLQERVVQPLGGRPTPVDVRIVSATNSELATAIENGDFRQDLYYRLAGYVLRLPTLAERIEDLPEIVEHFLRRFSDEIGKNLQGMTIAALRALANYGWPGNIRQLEHEVRRMAYLAYPGQAIDTTLLSPEILEGTQASTLGLGNSSESSTANATAGAGPSHLPTIPGHHAGHHLPTLDLKSLEKMAIEAALEVSDGTLIDAATRLGLTRDSLRRRLVRHGLREE